MPRLHRHASLWLAWLTTLLPACAPISREARTNLDARTGTTLTVADAPMVLARERRDLAVQARDYLTLLAAEINVTGNRQLVLVAHQWSTIDTRIRGRTRGPAEVLVLIADGRDLALQPMSAPPLDLPGLARELGRPDDADVSTAFYPIDADTLRYVALAGRISAVFPHGSPPLPFDLWRDGRAAQSRLLDAIGP